MDALINEWPTMIVLMGSGFLFGVVIGYLMRDRPNFLK